MSSHDTPSDPLKATLPSRQATVGPERAPHRAFYYAMGLSAEEILIRLFHQETVRLLDAREVTHEWPQAWDKVRDMLRSLGRAELDAMLAEHGEILIHDDLSNHEYRFDADDVAALFAEPPAEPRILH